MNNRIGAIHRTLRANDIIAQVRRVGWIKGTVKTCLNTTQKRFKSKIFPNFQAKNADEKEFSGIF
ncbi:MAG: hypothetical protein A2Z38_03105 [Planctomycetes bacterium RBG_19FT_COMBO_48_8]|nr:MAG: hypothetical protein A2Z38_03105 [Planctomycetes bacterium RBG_19FT_COMBO_48_8]